MTEFWERSRRHARRGLFAQEGRLGRLTQGDDAPCDSRADRDASEGE